MVKKICRRIGERCLSFLTFITVFIKKGLYKNSLVLINTPTHGNIGDQAITQAEIEYFKRYYPQKKLLVITEDEWNYHKKSIIKIVKVNQLVLIHGGGYIGTLWEDEANRAFEIMLCFPDNKKILMPQTAYYSNEIRKKHDREILSRIRNLEVFARDEDSFYIFTNELGIQRNKVHIVPDIVTTLRISSNRDINRYNDLLVVIRNDIEKNTNSELVKRIEYCFEKNTVVKNTDMFEKYFLYVFRKYYIKRKLKEFQSSKLVVTDRLHGMYFAAITGTPCMVLDNVSHKVKGGYKWLKNYQEIQLFNSENDLLSSLEKKEYVKQLPFEYIYQDEKFSVLNGLLE